MKTLIFILIISFLINFSAYSQKNKIRFQSINQFAMVGGESQVNSAYQTINGIRFSNWFSGIGIGVDNYRYRTLPLFFDGRWYFGYEKRGFIYGDIGYNFPMKDKPGKEIYYYDSYHFTGGVYTDFGIGYQVPLYKKSSMLFSLGYSSKKMTNRVGVNTGVNIICYNYGGCPVSYENYDFSFNTMILKAGLVF
ncbi:MAG TPA: hypothetical protein VIJ95_10550 [Hanamia sp.]